jgi:hypothetical protein
VRDPYAKDLEQAEQEIEMVLSWNNSRLENSFIRTISQPDRAGKCHKALRLGCSRAAAKRPKRCSAIEQPSNELAAVS